MTVLTVQGGTPRQAQSQEPDVVEELLQLDTQAALLAARKKIVGPLDVPGPVVTHGTENILLAIYGVGPSLSAEVLIDAEPHIFKNKHSQAISGRSVAYTLERIDPPCIHLKRHEHSETLCLGQIFP
ncbi:MAG: hypothetical protein NBV66_05585 [Burkholderiaceae bacterium]|nr:hypothetical protein [Burkholderiaceae bacterium]